MKPPIVLIGIGELGGVFARGFLRAGYPVYPIVRGSDMASESRRLPDAALVLVTVGEADLHPLLSDLPAPWRNRLGLLQNELMPRDWLRHGLSEVTVAVVWFEKKPGMALTNILDTPVYGPGAEALTEALTEVGIPTRILADEQALLFELAKKSLYILTVNIAGLAVGGTVGALWQNHRIFARQVATEVLSVLEWRAGQPLPRESLIAGMAVGIEDCPDRGCTGRSARLRLERVLAEARQAGLATPTLADVWRQSKSP
ncbi:MAG: hypothetical protein Kow0060_08580 [Methylohalobius crimeensis]